MSTSLTEANLEKKLQGATNSQDSIQTLSLWLLHHRAHHKKIVNTWLQVLKKAKISQRLTLFYLANDVIQNSKRKGISLFKESFAEVLKEVTLLVRDEQIRPSVSRIFNIWSERKIYDTEFIEDLLGILENSKIPITAPSKLLAEFKYENVIEKLRTVTKVELDTKSKMATVNINKLNATNAEIVQKLKDRSHGQQFSSEFDESTRGLEDLIKSLTKEIQERNELILLLEQSQIFYDTQRGEAKIVSNAYKNFGCRIKALQKKLEDLMHTFPEPSPIPSPCPDAPSPTTSDFDAELELPSEDVVEEHHPDESNSNSKPLVNSVGEPIPILSSFFNQDRRKMSSWLDAFSTPSVKEAKDSESLDSRLSNLMQNIPMLPTGIQESVPGTPQKSLSPLGKAKGNRQPSSSSDFPTLTKDMYSGQSTPLQDEDQCGTNSFFNRLSSSKSHSPKDILKGLTNLIHTASKDKSFKTVGKNHSRKDQIESKADKIFGHLSQTSSSPVFQTSAGETMKLDQSLILNSPSTIKVDTTETFFSQQPLTGGGSIHKNLSFIPTIVPSTPTNSSFKFEGDKQDLSTQSFDMELASEESNDSNLEKRPAVGIEEDIVMPTLLSPRQSTLITLVTDNSASMAKSELPYSSLRGETYPPNKQWTPTDVFAPELELSKAPLNNPDNGSDKIMEMPPSHSNVTCASNGRGRGTQSDDWSQSKIETVQSFRSNFDHNKWSGNDWPESGTKHYPFSINDRTLQTAQGYPDPKSYHKRHNLRSQTPMGWHHQQYSNRGHPRQQFAPFPSRGRGWNRGPNPY